MKREGAVQALSAFLKISLKNEAVEGVVFFILNLLWHHLVGESGAVCGMEGGVNQHRFISLSRNDLCGSWDNEWGQSTAQRLSGCHTADAGPKGS